jgi:hypothetical protein
MAPIVWRFWAHRIGVLVCAAAVTLVSSGALNAPAFAASGGRSKAEHQIVIKSVVVTKLNGLRNCRGPVESRTGGGGCVPSQPPPAAVTGCVRCEARLPLG